MSERYVCPGEVLCPGGINLCTRADNCWALWVLRNKPSRRNEIPQSEREPPECCVVDYGMACAHPDNCRRKA